MMAIFFSFSQFNHTDRYTPGVDMVTHKRVRDGSEVNTLSLESVTIDRDAPVDWAGASSEANRKFFAVNMRVTVRMYPLVYLYLLLFVYSPANTIPLPWSL